jgi:hypothetical protein
MERSFFVLGDGYAGEECGGEVAYALVVDDQGLDRRRRSGGGQRG